MQELAPASFSDQRNGGKHENIFFKKNGNFGHYHFWTRILKSKECSGDAPSPLPEFEGGSTISCKIPCDGKGRGEPTLPVNKEICPRILPGTEIWCETEIFFLKKAKKKRK